VWNPIGASWKNRKKAHPESQKITIVIIREPVTCIATGTSED
jgi:hypothetical protein